jgi:predicted TPR repeat methyltransferase
LLKQFLKRRLKIARGFYRTYVRGNRQAYDPKSWWDTLFYTGPITDEDTIGRDRGVLTTAYHYASVEMLILRHLRNAGLKLDPLRVCDIGSGAGHWIEFYLSLGATECVGIDISQRAVEHNKRKYAGRENVSFHHGNAGDVLPTLGNRFDLVNAIGVMFHLVDDTQWTRTIEGVANVLEPGGIFIVGGHFGLINNLNVQYDAQHNVNKKLRSAAHWKATLKEAGFTDIQIHRNRAYLSIADPIPENNILTARRK